MSHILINVAYFYIIATFSFINTKSYCTYKKKLVTLHTQLMLLLTTSI